MSTNIIAVLIGALTAAILIWFRIHQKHKLEAFRDELTEEYRQEADK